MPAPAAYRLFSTMPLLLQFVVANPTPRYAALLGLLPQTFVGSAEQLEHVVEWVCRQVQGRG